MKNGVTVSEKSTSNRTHSVYGYPMLEKVSLIGLIRLVGYPMLEKVPLYRLKAGIWDEYA
ncbi:hypothetical protein D3C73_1661320 [compost metagenome]